MLALVVLTGCNNPPYSQGSLDELYPQPPRPELRQRSVNGRLLHWAELGRGERPIVFIHGSPGDWKAWARYLDHPELSDYGPRRAVDRPGFGAAGNQNVMTDLRAQAAQLAELLPDGQRSIVVGHSLGGPLVSWLAIEFPDQVCGGVILAGALAPALEAPRWYNRIAEWPGLRSLLPEPLRRANEEMMSLESELRLLESHWSRLERPLRVLQGLKDELVHPATADFVERLGSNTPVTVERLLDSGHFLPWNDTDHVVRAIRELSC